MFELAMGEIVSACAGAALAVCPPQDPPRALLLIEPELLADQSVKQAVDGYVAAVRSRFAYEVLI